MIMMHAKNAQQRHRGDPLALHRQRHRHNVILQFIPRPRHEDGQITALLEDSIPLRALCLTALLGKFLPKEGTIIMRKVL